MTFGEAFMIQIRNAANRPLALGMRLNDGFPAPIPIGRLLGNRRYPSSNRHALALHELRKFCSLLERKDDCSSPSVADMEDRYEGFIYPPIPRETPKIVCSKRNSRPTDVLVASLATDCLDKLLDMESG